MKTTLTTLGISLLVLAGCAGQNRLQMISFRRILIMQWHRKHFRQTLSKNLAKFLIRVPLIRMVAFTTFLSMTGALVSFLVIFGIRTN